MRQMRWSRALNCMNGAAADYYITYTNQEGKTVEAMLSNPGDHKFEEGDRLRIKYLPDKQEYPVMVENC